MNPLAKQFCPICDRYDRRFRARRCVICGAPLIGPCRAAEHDIAAVTGPNAWHKQDDEAEIIIEYGFADSVPAAKRFYAKHLEGMGWQTHERLRTWLGLWRSCEWRIGQTRGSMK